MDNGYIYISFHRLNINGIMMDYALWIIIYIYIDGLYP